MKFAPVLLLSFLLVGGSALAKTKKQAYGTSKAKSAHSKAPVHGKKRRGLWKRHGQQSIDGNRAREIQTALVREKYLTGDPSGVWDQRTRDAMVRYQADHGWQTKSLPDSRALIQLGLGPKHENLLNPESVAAMPVIAVPAVPAPVGTASAPTSSALSGGAPQRQ